jgi:hypothetical protein
LDKKEYKLRDANGNLVWRCNRCGRKLDNEPPCYEGVAPICLVCFQKLKAQQPPSNRSRNKFKKVKAHRVEFYGKAMFL